MNRDLSVSAGYNDHFRFGRSGRLNLSIPMDVLTKKSSPGFFRTVLKSILF